MILQHIFTGALFGFGGAIGVSLYFALCDLHMTVIRLLRSCTNQDAT